MADNRQIIASTNFLSKEGNTLEDGTVKYIYDSNVKSIKGSKFTFTDMAGTQDDDSAWYNSTSINGTVQLKASDSILKFCYIKNLSKTLDLSVSIAGNTQISWNTESETWNLQENGWNPGFYMVIPAGASLYFRVNGKEKCEKVHVYSSGALVIEYLIAK